MDGGSSGVSVVDEWLADRLWKAATDHIRACEDHLYESENTEADPGPGPASAPYDGCHDCIIRETLHVAWAIMRPSAGGPSAPAAPA